MIGTVALVLGGFGWMIFRAYRQARLSGESFAPEGKLRWTDDTPR